MKTRNFRGNEIAVATDEPRTLRRVFFEVIGREREEARARAKPVSKLLPAGAGRPTVSR